MRMENLKFDCDMLINQATTQMHHIVWIRNVCNENQFAQSTIPCLVLGHCWQLGFWQLVTDLKSFLPFLSFFLSSFSVFACARWEPMTSIKNVLQMHFNRSFYSATLNFVGCHFELNLKSDFLETSIYIVAIIHHLAWNNGDSQAKF